MKKITTLLASLLATVVLTSCGGDKPSDKLLDKNAMVYINVEDGKASPRAVNPDLPDNPAHLSPKELVAQAETMIFDTADGPGARFWLGGIVEERDYKDMEHPLRPVGEYRFKDIENARFVFFGDFIIDSRDPKNPKLVEHFFTFKNVHFVDKDEKVIGYIPQRVFREGWEKVKQAFEAKDYEKVYKLFEEVYTAYPCTPDEYEKLKAEGKN